MIYHTSPSAITKPQKFGRFGEFVFFSADVYSMTEAANTVVYGIDESQLNIVEACSMAYIENFDVICADIINDVAEMFDVDFDTAHDILIEKESEWDYDCDAEKSWDRQKLTAKAAKMMGFDGVQVEDEQGAAYMISIVDHFDKMRLLDESEIY